VCVRYWYNVYTDPHPPHSTNPPSDIHIQSCGWLVDNNAVISRWLLTQCTCAYRLELYRWRVSSSISSLPFSFCCYDFYLLFVSDIYVPLRPRGTLISILGDISRVPFVNFCGCFPLAILWYSLTISFPRSGEREISYWVPASWFTWIAFFNGEVITF
jgi:hypothetical protein